MMHMHGDSVLGDQKGMEAVLRHRRQNEVPVRTAFTTG